VRAGDLLTWLDGRVVQRVDDVQAVLSEAAIERPLAARVLRRDRWLELELVPVELTA
jgi:S1-C subfamily serine protease